MVAVPTHGGRQRDDGCNAAGHSTHRSLRLADVVHQRTRDFLAHRPRTRTDETFGHSDCMAPDPWVHAHPECDFVGTKYGSGKGRIRFLGRHGLAHFTETRNEVSESRPRHADFLVRRARGCASAYTCHKRSCETRVYTCVVVIDAWPNISCTIRRSAPWSRRWVAQV